MNLMVAQINTTVGAFNTNVSKIAAAFDRARDRGADLVIFPELTLTGYPPKDLLERRSFVTENLGRLEEVAALTKGLTAIVGYVDLDQDVAGKGLRNAAAVCSDGRIVSRHFKALIPTYDVFDEGRYFDAAPAVVPVDVGRARLGVTICEDAWNDASFWGERKYPIDPVEELAAEGMDLLVNLSASPYHSRKTFQRHEMFASLARRHGVAVAHCNLVGGNDGLLFDGASIVFGPDGSLLARAPMFEEGDIFVPINETRSDVTPVVEAGPVCDEEEIWRALVMGTRDYVRKCHFNRAVIGLSGGIDSALTAAIAAEALGPDNVYGVSMPSRYSSDHSRGDAEDLARNLGIDYREIAIEPAFQAFLDILAPSFEGMAPDVTEENLQARCRGVTLMALSNKLGALLLTTGNKSELAVGYATLYGDMCGGLAVISDAPKTMVYDLARWRNRDREIIPNSTIEKPPSAELRPDQKDTDSLPPYEELDPILRAYVEDHLGVAEICEKLGADHDLVSRIVRLVDRNEYKRQQAAPALRITTKAFGYGRRMPIAAYD